MKSTKTLVAILLLAGTVGLEIAPAGAAAVLLKVAASPSNNYCHMKFLAIREETLSWSQPVLQDASSGDIIDFYGPCNHDPLGKEEVHAQRLQAQRARWNAPE